MTLTDRDRIIDRVRKLMAFNDHTASEAEVENAMALAARLMERHAIERADVEDASPSETIARARDRSPLRRNLATWESILAHAIRAAVPGVSTYIDVEESAGASGRARRRTVVVWYGPEEAVAVARLLFDETRLIIATLAGGIYGGCYRGRGRSYAEGFATALLARVQRDREASGDRSRVTALALRDDERNRDWLAEAHGLRLGRRSASGGGRHDPSAFARGERDGAHHEFTGVRPRIGD